VKPYPQDGSGLISSLRASDGLIEIAEAIEAIDEGQAVSFIPYSEFGIHS
jgi:molybdopterin molybdotransferase